MDSLITLPETLVTEYERFLVYRGVKINTKKTAIDKTDFESQIERKLRRMPTVPLSEIEGARDWGKYSCSCFTEPDELNLALRLPAKGKRVAAGLVDEETGAYILNDGSTHVHWFIYDNKDPSQEFELV